MRFLTGPGPGPGRRAGPRGAALLAACAAALAAACGSGDEGASAGASAPFRSIGLLAGAVDAGGWGHVDGPVAQARFEGPSGVTVADDGAVWISEGERGRLRRLDVAGRVETVLPSVATLTIGKDTTGRPFSLRRLGPMAAAAGGAVYVAAEQVVWGAAAPDGSRTPVDERWVVLHVARDGNTTPVMRSRRPGISGAALGLAVDRSGKLLVSDAGAAPGAQPIPLALRWPAGFPHAHVGSSGMCTGDDGVLYVSYGHAVLRRAPDGQLAVWAGEVIQGGAADGVAAAARFNSPRGLVCVPGLLDRPNSLARVPGGMAVTTGLGVVVARY